MVDRAVEGGDQRSRAAAAALMRSKVAAQAHVGHVGFDRAAYTRPLISQQNEPLPVLCAAP